MKPRLLPAALAALCPAAVVAAQAPPEMVDKIVEEGMSNSRVMDYQHHLCNFIGPRLTGSDNFTVACNWARDEFEKMGLEAKLEEWDEWNVVWNRGQWMGRIVSPAWNDGEGEAEGEDAEAPEDAGVPEDSTGDTFELQVATSAWTAGTKGSVRGQLVAMPETEADLEALAPKMGEVYLWGQRPSRRSDIRERFNELLEETPPLGFVQSAQSTGLTDRRYDNQIRVFGNSNVARGSWERIPTIPEIVVRDDQADILEQMLESGEEVVVQFDIRNRFRKGPIALHNVIADLVGTEKPDEFVIVCGHLDSWHQATGATDNGTGTCTTMEAARILAAVGAKPKRTIRFILWGGEEQGLLGSQEYTKMHRPHLKNVSAVLNHDTGTNWAHSLTVSESMYEPFKMVMEPVMALTPPEDIDGPVFSLRRSASIGGFGGSDHASFLSKGVPAWSWGLKGVSSYGYGWHSQWDTYDIVIPEYQKHTAVVIALTALGLANLPELLPRDGVRRQGEGGSDRLGALIEREFGLEVDEELKVTKVIARGAGARAGLETGDVLTAMWDRTLESRVDIYRAWREHREEDVVVFACKRGDRAMKLKVDLSAIEEEADGAGDSGDAPTSRPAGESGNGPTSRRTANAEKSARVDVR